MRIGPGFSLRAMVAIVGIFLMGPTAKGVSAHEIPPSVTVQALVRAEGGNLRVLLRVPLNSMRDFAWPITGPGYLVLSEMEEGLREAVQLWILDDLRFFEEGRRLEEVRVEAIRISLPTDRSFSDFDRALENLQGAPLPESVQLYWEQALLDVLLEYPIDSDQARFAVESDLAHLGISTTTILRFQLPGSPERMFQFTGSPGRLELDPRWIQAFSRFVGMGFLHILEGIDHLLFLLCLVLPFRRVFPLLAVITSFTLAHSVTLIAAALGFAPQTLWFPPLIEVLIALSIVFMAFENIAGVDLRRRWALTFVFGLIHGFGFSFLLQESLPFAGEHVLSSLLAFNLGVELGQVAVLLLVLPLLGLVSRAGISQRMSRILLSALVAHTAWHWMADRWGELAEYPIDWPPLDATFLVLAMRWAMAFLAAGAMGWVLLLGLDRMEKVWGGGSPGPGGGGALPHPKAEEGAVP